MSETSRTPKTLPELALPSPKEVGAARREIGTLLTQLFQELALKETRIDYMDPRVIGERVAAAQENPGREGIPYHPAVVEAWLAGKLVPNDAALGAIISLVGEDNIKEDGLDALHSTIARFDSRQTMRSYTKSLEKPLGMSVATLAQACTSCSKKAKDSIRCELIGHNTLQPDTIAAFQQTLKIHGVPEDKAILASETLAKLAELRNQLGIDNEQSVALSSELTGKGDRARLARALGVTRPTVQSWLIGLNAVPPEKMSALERALHELKAGQPLGLGEAPSTCIALESNRLLNQRQEVETIWNEALKMKEAGSEPKVIFGKMLMACRVAMGLFQRDLPKGIAAVTGGKVVSHVSLSLWEHGTNFPTRKSFPGTDPVAAYGKLLEAHDTCMQEKMGEAYEPFWTNERETQMWEAFKAVISPAQTNQSESRGGKVTGTSWMDYITRDANGRDTSSPPRN